MNAPVTTLDPRFSDPDAVATPWDATRRALAEADLFWIATVHADGRPHVTPLVAVWVEEAIYFTTGSSEQKATNLQRNAHVILLTGCNQWTSGLDVVVEGDAVPVTDPDRLAPLAAAWARKWDGRWQYTARSGGLQHATGGLALVFVVHPTKILAFAKGTFSQTCYQF